MTALPDTEPLSAPRTGPRPPAPAPREAPAICGHKMLRAIARRLAAAA